jgi:Asp/Glu/hydantoin racemase
MSDTMVVVLHTGFVTIDDSKKMFNEMLPGVKIITLVDDSLLSEVKEKGGMTKNVIQKICTYGLNAELWGADAIFSYCSSMGAAIDVARQLVKIPFVKIDEEMAEQAARIGGRVTVIATLESTFGPTIELLTKTANEMKTNVQFKRCFVDNAFNALSREKDRAKHNAILSEAIRNVANESDVIVLAQSSMAIVLPDVQDLKIPVLASPQLGALRLKRILGL